MNLDALKKQGERTDLTLDQVGPKLSAKEISDEDSASQVKRYICLMLCREHNLEKSDM